MNLYFVTRWGNPYEEDGPDGKDTNFIVQATSVENSAKLVNTALKQYPTKIESNREVQNKAHHIVLLAKQSMAKDSSPQILHGPWIESAILQGELRSRWDYDEEENAWIISD